MPVGLYYTFTFSLSLNENADQAEGAFNSV